MGRHRRILVSGFEPFSNEKINPTQMIADYINSCESHARAWSSLDVRGVVLPVEFDGAFQRLERERLLFQPDVVLSFGLAAGRTTVDIEQVAINLRGSAMDGDGLAPPDLADNRGVCGSGLIDAQAPMALRTTLASAKILTFLQAAGLPARNSFSAGTYVCNDLFFQMQNRLRFTRVPSGFIHVPRLNSSDWTLSRFERVVDVILETFA